MSTIRGTVVSVQLDANVRYAPPKSGTYKGYQLIYTDVFDGTTKTFAKAMASLRMLPDIRSALESLKPGDTFTLTQEKVGQYNEVRSLVKGLDEDAAFNSAVAVAPESSTPARNYTPARSGNTYETPEERKLKQRLIVRQSSLAQALEYVVGGEVSEVLEHAEKFESWVYRGLE